MIVGQTKEDCALARGWTIGGHGKNAKQWIDRRVNLPREFMTNWGQSRHEVILHGLWYHRKRCPKNRCGTCKIE